MLLLTLCEPEHVIVQVLQNVAQTIWPRLSSTAVSEIIMHIFTKKKPPHYSAQISDQELVVPPMTARTVIMHL